MLTIYKASAGSGKTFNLTKRYIKLLLGYKSDDGRMHLRRNFRTGHRSILAVTFTNKATDEMKRRIIHELAVLAGMEPGWKKESPYAEDLMADFGCGPEELKKAAGEALRNLLFDFHYFQVSTIDSFFQLILRTFAREAELTGTFELDLENDNTNETAVRNLFTDLSLEPDSPRSRRLVALIQKYIEDRFAKGDKVSLFNRKTDIFGRFMDLIKRTDTETFKSRYDEMLDYLKDHDRIDRFRDQLSEALKIQKAEVQRLCREAYDIGVARGYIEIKKTGSKSKGQKLKLDYHMVNLLEKCIKSGIDFRKKDELGATEIKAMETPEEECNDDLKSVLESNPDPELMDAIRAAGKAIVEAIKCRKIYRALINRMYFFGLLEDVFHYVSQVRNENNTLYLSDTNSLLCNIIGEGDTPFVFERIGVWLNHFLIDEFQDTSRMQWEILRPLVAQGQSTDCDSLIIGDEKQCIYRFRASDPTLLQSKVQADFPGRTVIEGTNEKENTNWRSSADLVTFNNNLFERLAEKLGLSEIYGNVRQQISRKHKKHRGYVAAYSIKEKTKGDFEAKALAVMTEEMRRQLRSGYRGSEIAVLTRQRNEASAVINHIMQLQLNDPDFAGIRVISEDAMMLSEAPAVKMIISVLRYLDSIDREPVEDTEASAGQGAKPTGRRDRMREIKRMINCYEYLRCRGVSAEDALEKAVGNTGKIWDEIDEDITDIKCFNLVSLIERIIVRLFSEKELKSQNMFIAAFQDVVANYSLCGQDDLMSFLDWWDSCSHNLKVSAPDDDNAIRVMTIHKSKGLEFKCVHVPMIDKKLVEFKDDEWFECPSLPFIDDSVKPPLVLLTPSDKILNYTPFQAQYEKMCREQLLDELNVLYVALTRGVDELCIGLQDDGVEGVQAGFTLSRAIDTLDMMDEKELRITDEGEIREPDDDDENAGDKSGRVVLHTLGAPTVRREDEKDPPTALDADSTFEMPPYKTADRDDLWANTCIDELSDFTRPRDRGLILHSVMARVLKASDLDKAVAACVHSSLLPAAEAPEIKKLLSEEISRPEVARWFNGFRRAICERPLNVADSSGKEKHKRPDRVVWTADGFIDVIDYKFGEDDRNHSGQVTGYMKLLAQMGYSNLRGFLWYVGEGRIQQVSPPIEMTE